MGETRQFVMHWPTHEPWTDEAVANLIGQEVRATSEGDDGEKIDHGPALVLDAQRVRGGINLKLDAPASYVAMIADPDAAGW